MNRRFPSPNLAAECAAHEDEKQRQAIEFEESVDSEIAYAYLMLISQSVKWVIDHVADPYEELALVYKQIAIYKNEPQNMSVALRNILENKIRLIAENAVNASK